MADVLQVVAFSGGELRTRGVKMPSGEAVLALPLSRLIVKMIRVPSESDAVAFSTPILTALSPFPAEPLTVSCETVRESEQGQVVLAAALPESAADDIASALDAAKINVTRVDSLALGELRGLWAQLDDGRAGVRRLVLLQDADCISMVVLDDDHPSAIRAVYPGSDLRREAMLSLLEAEDFGGPRALTEVVSVGETDVMVLAALAPVRKVVPASDPLDLALAGVAERSADPTALDVLPASWREFLGETRFKAKLVRSLSVAGGIWALVMLVLFGVPVVYGFLADHQKALSKAHARPYRAVLATKEKVDLVRKYSDHARGALEVMKLVSDSLPLPERAATTCIELSSWSFKREDGVQLSGSADSAQLVYQFKDALIASGVFATVDLRGLSASKDRQTFEIECRFQAEEAP